jgi:hypothetical protein
LRFQLASSSELAVGNLASLTPAEGVEAAALFRYTLPSRLWLHAHGSALVPFLDSAIKVRQIAWFSAQGEAAASALLAIAAARPAELDARRLARRSKLPFKAALYRDA